MAGSGPFVVIRHADPAVDGDADIKWSDYFASRDPSLLRFHPGKQPVEFYCRPLTVSERREVKIRRDSEGRSTPMSREMAFRLGVMKVLRLPREGGEARDWERPDDKKAMTDAMLELFGDSTIEDVGSVIEARSFLDLDQRLVCPLLGISVLVQAGQRLRPVEPTSDSSSSLPSKPDPAATPTASTSPSDSQPTAESGGATATG